MNTKRKGAAFERKVKKDLEDKNWTVIRQAASRFPDLVAIRKIEGETRTILVECKINKGLDKQEKIMFHSYERTLGVPVIMATKQDKIRYYTINGTGAQDGYKETTMD